MFVTVSNLQPRFVVERYELPQHIFSSDITFLLLRFRVLRKSNRNICWDVSVFFDHSLSVSLRFDTLQLSLSVRGLFMICLLGYQLNRS